MAILSVLILGAGVVGLATIDFDEDGGGVAAGPGDETTTTFEAPETTITTGGSTATTGGSTATTIAPSQATTQPTVATTGAPATTAAPVTTTPRSTTTAAAVGGTATTAPGSGLGATGSGQAGQAPLATSGGEDMLLPALALLLGAVGIRSLQRRAAPPTG